MHGPGVDHVATADDPVMDGISVAEVIERQVAEPGMLALEASEGLRPLAPVEVRVGEDVPATGGAAGQAR